MGTVYSALRTLRFALNELLSLRGEYAALQKRVQAIPELPSSGSRSQSYWTVPPLKVDKSPLQAHADVLIIGTGITGCSVARMLLNYHQQHPLTIVMLDAANGVCDGATGRNGGHIKPECSYRELKARYGESSAKTIIRFRLAHLDELRRVAEKEGILPESQCREVESLDVFLDQEAFEDAVAGLVEWKADMKLESSGYETFDGEEARRRFQLGPHVCGVIQGKAGAVSPYRLVTGIYSRLLAQFGDRFSIHTNTPCTSIERLPGTEKLGYKVTTPAGTISATHVVHATNAYVSNLLPSLRGKIFPIRGTMTAQRPGRKFPQLEGSRSWTFFYKDGFDYLTQQPGRDGELMFGGAISIGNIIGVLGELGVSNDTDFDPRLAAHLSGALPVLFGDQNWGADSAKDEEGSTQWGEGRVKATWSGVMGMSVDGMPWVGRLSEEMTGRSCSDKGAEWLAAGYGGEGMAHAYLCGKALALMLLGKDEENGMSGWLPSEMRVTLERWKRANFDEFLLRNK